MWHWLGLDLSIMYLGLNVSFSFRKHCVHPIKVSISVIFIQYLRKKDEKPSFQKEIVEMLQLAFKKGQRKK